MRVLMLVALMFAACGDRPTIDVEERQLPPISFMGPPPDLTGAAQEP